MTKISRRDFLKVSFTAGGALLVGTYLEACAPADLTDTPLPMPTGTSTAIPEPPFQPNRAHPHRHRGCGHFDHSSL